MLEGAHRMLEEDLVGVHMASSVDLEELQVQVRSLVVDHKLAAVHHRLVVVRKLVVGILAEDSHSLVAACHKLEEERHMPEVVCHLPCCLVGEILLAVEIYPHLENSFYLEGSIWMLFAYLSSHQIRFQKSPDLLSGVVLLRRPHRIDVHVQRYRHHQHQVR